MFMSRFFPGPSSGINPVFTAALIFISSSIGIRTVTMNLNAAGTATATGDTPPNWALPAYSNVGAEWWVNFSHSGIDLTLSSGTEGVWLSLTGGSTIAFQNAAPSSEGTGYLTMQFSLDAGLTVAASKIASIDVGYVAI